MLRRRRLATIVAVPLLLGSGLSACSGAEAASDDTEVAGAQRATEPFAEFVRTAPGLDAPTADELGPKKDAATGLTIAGGVETLTVTGADKSEELVLENEEGHVLLTLLAEMCIRDRP